MKKLIAFLFAAVLTAGAWANGIDLQGVIML